MRSLDQVRDATIVLPEFFLGSYTQFAGSVYDRPGLAAILSPLQSFTQQRRLSLVGSLPVQVGVAATNEVVVIQQGTIWFSAQTKQHLYGHERGELSRRANASTLCIAGVMCTVQVCMDIVDPGPARQAVGDGARVIMGPATVSVDFLRTIHKARALENQVVSIFCNRRGAEQDGTEYLGRSAIFLPDGSELSAPRDGDQVLLMEVDLAAVVGYRVKFG